MASQVLSGRKAARERAAPAVVVRRIVAVVVVVLIAMRIELQFGLTVGYLAAAALAPLWFPVLREYRGARALLIAGLVALGSGLWLTELARDTHEISLGIAAGWTFRLAGVLCSVGFILWARKVIPGSWLALCFGLGLLAGGPTASELYEQNPWRFGFSFAVSIIVLALATLAGRRWLGFVAALGLTVVAMFTDARSSFAILLLTALLLGWQLLPARTARGRSGARVVIALAALAVVVYNFGQAAIVAGYFGQTTQQRTIEQLDASGSLILGGRPELAATLALMQDRPIGFGVGTLPNLGDILTAKSGMAEIGYEPNNGYVERYMLGGHIELHSLFGDLWAHFGIPGLALAGFILFLILRGIGATISARSASPVLIFLVVTAGWTFFFGPFYSAERMLILTLGLVMLPGASTTTVTTPPTGTSPPRPSARNGRKRRSGLGA
ncbi:O-antigen ligase family protein [Cryobacterium tagatosivorans]|uniref:O-antigen ligase family protein n=1 Tax=Cryobacterium tagatosivorans TaxID=1259199 RepID=UPI00141B5D45|nr:O-antigen ligase family protein [Cryobacterium tagatosivorans]